MSEPGMSLSGRTVNRVCAVSLVILFAAPILFSTLRESADLGKGRYATPAAPQPTLGAPSVKPAEPGGTGTDTGGATMGGFLPVRPLGAQRPRHRHELLPSPSPRPTVRPVAAHVAPRAPVERTAPRPPAVGLATWTAAAGVASHMGPRYAAWYLALPQGRGVLARICGAGGCVTMRSTDAGPDKATQRRGRIADLSMSVFVRVCGVPASAGLCRVSVRIL
jgi:hypothetical protein